MNNQNICTIVAKNYIAFARTLCNSFLDLHPDGKCYVLIIDETDGYIDQSEEVFKLLRISDLNIPNIDQLCFKYNTVELCTATKPYLLQHIINNKNIDKLLYIDPDILITNKINDLFNELDSNDIILTPHIDEDFPDDGLMPDDSHIMKSGIFNLGFIGINKCSNVQSFLSWWQDKLYSKCVIDFESGYFVDQKFIDLSISLFPNIKMIKEVGYNVAYWNLHSRKISNLKNIWMCNNTPLYFFHFSGYNPKTPYNISKYQNRYTLKKDKVLNNLFSHYRKLVLENDYTVTSSWPYTYNYYHNGKTINWSSRNLYRIKGTSLNIDNPFEFSNYSVLYKFQSLLLWIRKAILFSIKRIYTKGNLL